MYEVKNTIFREKYKLLEGSDELENKEGKPARLRNESCEKYGENREFLVTVGQVKFLFSCLQIYTIETEDTEEDELVGDEGCEGRKRKTTEKTYNNTAPSKPD